MEHRTLHWILWLLFLNLSDAMLNGRKLTTSDFISIDCGATQEYTDPGTGISYQTDTGFVDTGHNHMVAPERESHVDFRYFGRQLQTLRSFPEGRRNCYTLKPKQGKNQNYLIRAFFSYGNYNQKNQTPSFDLYLGTNHWTDVNLGSGYTFEEIIHTPITDTIYVCLVKSGIGIPFISTLELRPLTNYIYNTSSPSQSLLDLDFILDVGFISTENITHIRYTDDIYDRVWRNDHDKAVKLQDWNEFNEPVDFNHQITNDSYRLPERVLQSAAKSSNRFSALNFDCDSVWGGPSDQSFNYYVYFHFAEIEKLPMGQKRVIDITVNGVNFLPKPITLEYLKPLTVFTVTNQSCLQFNISATSESAAPPILNALEVYKLISPLNLPKDPVDVDAILDIKRTYKIPKSDWQGDPCIPDYTWEGLACNSSTNHSYARITSLNMSTSELTGAIAISFSQLMELESLDLSDNHLSGTIPEFLAELPKLRVLILRGNNLEGSIPQALLEKPDLEMSVDGNPDLCLTDPCKKHKFVIPLLASLSALIGLIFLVSLGIWIFRIKRRLKGHGSSKLRNRAFSYSKVLEITNKFQNLIGEGGFGKVYLGTLKNDIQVAVKLLSQSSIQGHREFRSEVELLMIVHHRHVVSLIGYCEETGARALIYEYMANGDLRQHLSSNNGDALKWKNMLRIALDAACGLEYLHNGCKPAIVHRDLKTTNILLDEHMEAKIADFGLSRAFANDIDSHVSTRPAGTIGYLDPEFQNSGNLTKGSDIYSFGIILLELITGQPAAKRKSNYTFSLLLHWVAPKVQNKEIESIVDPRLKGNYNVDSIWKFLEIAMSCTEPSANQRPDISRVVYELRECLAMETSMEVVSDLYPNSSNYTNMSAMEFDSDLSILSGR